MLLLAGSNQGGLDLGPMAADKRLLAHQYTSYLQPTELAARGIVAKPLEQQVPDTISDSTSSRSSGLRDTSTLVCPVVLSTVPLPSCRSPVTTHPHLACVQRLFHLQHRAQMHKRLTTTVEEDATNKDHYAALADRREKAAALKLQLEHKLKTQRLEQAKQIGVLQVCM